MPDLLYVVWGLLPLALLWLTVLSGSKTALKRGTREYPKSYLRELVFSSLALVGAIVIDKTMLSPTSLLRLTIESFNIDYRIFRWLIYPAIIAGAAMLQQRFIDKERAEAEAEKTARRLKYAAK